MFPTEWLWYGRTPGARAARLLLLPASLMYSATKEARERLYSLGGRRARRETRPLPVPTVAIGNLEVGGTGKTPFAGWLAERYLARGAVPGIVHNGYAVDEVLHHRRTLPDAVITCHRDRLRAGREAAVQGADVLILDDALQARSIEPDLKIALIAAESRHAARWQLPAGPWRESLDALATADYVVITRKTAAREDGSWWRARLLQAGIDVPIGEVRLGISGFRFPPADKLLSCSAVSGLRVLALAGIGAPCRFGDQLRSLGAEVTLRARPDHHRYTRKELEKLFTRSGGFDRVVVTAKDAVKLGRLWPQEVADPLVAELKVEWEEGLEEFESLLPVVPADGAETFKQSGGSAATSRSTIG